MRVKSTGATPAIRGSDDDPATGRRQCGHVECSGDEPWGTVTEAGTKSAGLLLERSTLTFPAGLDIV